MYSAYIRVAAMLSIALSQHSILAAQSAAEPLPEAEHGAVGFDSVAEALKALRAKPGIVLGTENGWLIATDEANFTIWSFAPEGYPAYPAVVQRRAIPRGTGSTIEMNVLCEASKVACDELVRTFAQMNDLPIDQ